MLLCIAVTVHQLYVFISGTWRVVSIAAASVALSNMEIGFFFFSCISQIGKVKCMEIGESTYCRNVMLKTWFFFSKFWNCNRKKTILALHSYFLNFHIWLNECVRRLFLVLTDRTRKLQNYLCPSSGIIY